MNLQNEVTVNQNITLVKIAIATCSAFAIIGGFLLFSSSLFNSEDVLANENQNSISGVVFNDINKNEIFDLSEVPIPNAQVELYFDKNSNQLIDEEDQLLNTYKTAFDGKYNFSFESAFVSNTISIQISDYNDDVGEFDDGEIELNDNDLHIGYRLAATRFKNVHIPNGAIIESAYIQLKSQDDKQGFCKTEIFGEAVPNSLAFNEEPNNVSSRVQTINSSLWSPGNWKRNDVVNTPSLVNLVQEIIDQEAWKAGNNLTFFFKPLEGHRDAMSREEHINSGPTLKITYRFRADQNSLLLAINSKSLENGTQIVGSSYKGISTIDGITQATNFPVFFNLKTEEWKGFSANQMNDHNQLVWLSDEEDNSHFEVQKSYDQKHWNVLDEISALIKSDEENFTSLDYPEENGLVYYRIKKVKHDGSYAYSSTVPVNFGSKDANIDVFPIPANDLLNIRPLSNNSTTISLINNSGTVIKQEKISQAHKFKVSDLPNGVYYVKSNSSIGVVTKKILIQH